jgi:hypothetical protein
LPSDITEIAPSKREFVAYMASNYEKLQEWVFETDRFKNHLTFFSTERGYPLQQGNATVHAHITIESVRRALDLFTKTEPHYQSTRDFRFWYSIFVDKGRSVPFTNLENVELAPFFLNLRNNNSTSLKKWHDYVEEWRNGMQSTWVKDKMPKALRVAVLAAHEVENTKKEKVVYASEELAREDCLRRLKNLRFKPDDNRANFVRQLRGILRMANVEESRQFDYFMTAVKPFWNDPTVNTFEEAIESFVRSDSSSEKFEVLSG